MKNFLIAPCDGTLIDITKVEDEMFAKKMLGNGVAIIPDSGEFVSPCDGTLKVLMETKHAYGISNSDFEILIHIGLDTVNLKGKGFSPYVKKGSKIKKGEKLANVDLEVIKKNNFKIDTPIIFLDNPNIKFKILKTGKVKQGDKIIELL